MPKNFDNVRAVMDEIVGSKNGPAGANIAVHQNGECLFSYNAGYADLASGKKVSDDTIFRIYSMSKVVTCAAALQLFEQGKYLLNDPIEEYIPAFKDAKVYQYDGRGHSSAVPSPQKPLIKHFFAMQSGMPYPGGGSRSAQEYVKAMGESFAGIKSEMTIEQAVNIVANVPLGFVPGTAWEYGYSHDVLGRLIEVISGMNFGAYLKKNIFDPLGMNDTSFTIAPEKAGRLATVYVPDESGALVPRQGGDDNYQPGAKFQSGGGGLLSTLTDYAKFANCLATGGQANGVRILGRKTIDLMRTPQLTEEIRTRDFAHGYHAGYSWGLGVRTMVNPAEGGVNSSIGEFGWCGAAGTWASMDPAEGLSIVYMQQRFPNREEYIHPRLRAAIFANL